MPEAVQDILSYNLDLVQCGRPSRIAKPLQGFSGVCELVVRYDTNAYRAVYVVNLGDAIYVLHAFQKKSSQGIKTPQVELAKIKQRLKWAKELADG